MCKTCCGAVQIKRRGEGAALESCASSKGLKETNELSVAIGDNFAQTSDHDCLCVQAGCFSNISASWHC